MNRYEWDVLKNLYEKSEFDADKNDDWSNLLKGKYLWKQNLLWLSVMLLLFFMFLFLLLVLNHLFSPNSAAQRFFLFS